MRVLTRNPGAAAGKLPYPRVQAFGPAQWAAALQGATVVINLAGGYRITPAYMLHLLVRRGQQVLCMHACMRGC